MIQRSGVSGSASTETRRSFTVNDTMGAPSGLRHNSYSIFKAVSFINVRNHKVPINTRGFDGGWRNRLARNCQNSSEGGIQVALNSVDSSVPVASTFCPPRLKAIAEVQASLIWMNCEQRVLLWNSL